GSTDNSYKMLLEMYQSTNDKKLFKIVKLRKNCGQNYAIEAGISHASGDFIGFISADLQDPIELFLEMIHFLEQDEDLVIAKREARKDKGISKFLSMFTHYLVNKYVNKNFPQGGYDFCMFTKKVAKEVLKVKERNGQLPILLLSFGFKYKFLNYERKKREAGKSQWTFNKKIKLFIDIFTSNSYLPLRAVSVIGIGSSIASVFYFIFVLFEWLFFKTIGEDVVKGWTTIVLLITFFSGLILLSIGIIGEYIWRILDEVKNRDRYLIDNKIGFEND
ncbi:glycosyltransferase, partial [Arcobacter sp. F2176]|uniref:glycosyltransferase n=1 Tax=Arcobacter sp. F2176 TaxID=2044511 RepID=UPI00100BF1BF